MKVGACKDVNPLIKKKIMAGGGFPGNQKTPWIRHCDIYETLSPATIGDNYADTLKVLNDYFLPKKNVEFEVYKFRQTKQEVNESLDTYYTQLKQLAKYCQFDNIEKEIKSQIIQACLSNKVRRKALRYSGITLQQILDFARAMDATDSHMTEMEEPNMNTDRLDAVRKRSTL